MWKYCLFHLEIITLESFLKQDNVARQQPYYIVHNRSLFEIDLEISFVTCNTS